MFENCYRAAVSIVIAYTVLDFSPVQAKPVSYDFKVNVTQGKLSGTSFGGNFSYDDSVLDSTGSATLKVENGLTVNMNFFGQSFTAKDDINYPNFPQLSLENGEVKELDFWVEPGKRGKWWGLPGWEIELIRRNDK